MNGVRVKTAPEQVSAGCHINDVMNLDHVPVKAVVVSAGCHINDVMNR